MERRHRVEESSTGSAQEGGVPRAWRGEEQTPPQAPGTHIPATFAFENQRALISGVLTVSGLNAWDFKHQWAGLWESEEGCEETEFPPLKRPRYEQPH